MPFQELKEGWKYLFNASKWHYFVDGRSLCRKWATFSNKDFQQGNNDSPDNCRSCRTKLLKIKDECSTRAAHGFCCCGKDDPNGGPFAPHDPK